jgi:hypothetical protein
MALPMLMMILVPKRGNTSIAVSNISVRPPVTPPPDLVSAALAALLEASGLVAPLTRSSGANPAIRAERRDPTTASCSGHWGNISGVECGQRGRKGKQSSRPWKKREKKF